MHVSTSDLEKALGMTIDGVDHFLVANGGRICMYADSTYECKYTLTMELPESDDGKDLQIISMTASHDGHYVAVSVGKNQLSGIEIIT